MLCCQPLFQDRVVECICKCQECIWRLTEHVSSFSRSSKPPLGATSAMVDIPTGAVLQLDMGSRGVYPISEETKNPLETFVERACSGSSLPLH